FSGTVKDSDVQPLVSVGITAMRSGKLRRTGPDPRGEFDLNGRFPHVSIPGSLIRTLDLSYRQIAERAMKLLDDSVIGIPSLKSIEKILGLLIIGLIDGGCGQLP